MRVQRGEGNLSPPLVFSPDTNARKRERGKKEMPTHLSLVSPVYTTLMGDDRKGGAWAVT